MDRIKTAETIKGKSDLIEALFAINISCHCITKDSGIIDTLESIGREINEAKSIPADYKESYDRSLQDLKKQVNEYNNAQ